MFFSLRKERKEAENLFSSKEAEEEVKKIAVKTVTSDEVSTAEEVPKEEHAPKPVAPTPEQIIAIKVF